MDENQCPSDALADVNRRKTDLARLETPETFEIGMPTAIVIGADPIRRTADPIRRTADSVRSIRCEASRSD